MNLLEKKPKQNIIKLYELDGQQVIMLKKRHVKNFVIDENSGLYKYKENDQLQDTIVGTNT